MLMYSMSNKYLTVHQKVVNGAGLFTNSICIQIYTANEVCLDTLKISRNEQHLQ